MNATGAYLAGRHALVTGGGKGIGAAIALELARLGARLTLLGRTEAPLREHSERLKERFGAESHVQQGDVADEASLSQAIAEARSRLGDIHVLVNSAGIGAAATLLETSKELWDRLIGVNLTGTFLCSRAVLDGMLRAGWGRIINISSTAGLQGHGRITAYCASKHGVIGFTRALAREVARSGITVNALCPSYTDTGMAAHAAQNVSLGTGKSLEEARTMLTRVIPLGRLIEPDEVASLAGWLCGPHAAAVTGTAIPVAGGEV